jgi:hypothetical protein
MLFELISNKELEIISGIDSNLITYFSNKFNCAKYRSKPYKINFVILKHINSALMKIKRVIN